MRVETVCRDRLFSTDAFLVHYRCSLRSLMCRVERSLVRILNGLEWMEAGLFHLNGQNVVDIARSIVL